MASPKASVGRRFEMKETTKENIVITIAGLLSAVLAVVAGTTLYLHGITISFKTYNLVFTTIMVFGTLGYFYKEDLKRSLRAAITFGAMVVAHILIYLNLFQHGIGVSSARVGFTVILEFGVAGIILIVVGGAKYGHRK
jgi:hypothetical protein